jgi:hypothetical protein
MKMPSKIATWLLIVYFLLVGLAGLGLVSSLGTVTAVVAVAAAVFLFLDR